MKLRPQIHGPIVARGIAAVCGAVFAIGTVSSAHAADVRVVYDVDSALLKRQPAGVMLTFELFGDPLCGAAIAGPDTVALADPGVLIEQLTIVRAKTAPKPVQIARLNFLMTGVLVLPNLYAKVTGLGITPVGGVCQPQPALAGGSVTSVSAGAPLSVTNPTTTPNISLGIVPVVQGGTNATTASGARTSLGAASSGANADITALSALTTPLALAQGGTNATTASAARASLGAASSGSNGDITKLTGLTTPLALAAGGTGASTAAGARTALGAAGSGANADITALTGLTTPLALAAGGTGASTASGARTALGAAASGANADITGLSGLTGDLALPGNLDLLGNLGLFGNVALLGNVTLSDSGNANVGNLVKGGATFLHNFGTANTFLGANAGNFSLTGGNNTAMGNTALGRNTTGANNTAVGAYTLVFNTAGANNTAVGATTLVSNATGANNTAVGQSAMFSNSAGTWNTGLGVGALYSNTTGGNNTAVGGEALGSTTTANNNTAVGVDTLYSNTTGVDNVALGYNALFWNATGQRNTALGNYAMFRATGGIANLALGYNAGINLTTGDDNIDLRNDGFAGDANTIRIGTAGHHFATYIAGITGATSSGGVAVFINGAGQLGTTTSSARFKDDIQDMGDSTDGLMQLRPVRFRYKPEIDPSGLQQYGLIAEDVAKVYPDLVVYDDAGQAQTVRYHFVNAMLLNEVQKQHQQIQTQAQQIADLTTRLAALEAAVTIP